jgi:hypothetical protein
MATAILPLVIIPLHTAIWFHSASWKNSTQWLFKAIIIGLLYCVIKTNTTSYDMSDIVYCCCIIVYGTIGTCIARLTGIVEILPLRILTESRQTKGNKWGVKGLNQPSIRYWLLTGCSFVCIIIIPAILHIFLVDEYPRELVFIFLMVKFIGHYFYLVFDADCDDPYIYGPHELNFAILGDNYHNMGQDRAKEQARNKDTSRSNMRLITVHLVIFLMDFLPSIILCRVRFLEDDLEYNIMVAAVNAFVMSIYLSLFYVYLRAVSSSSFEV